MSVWFKAWGGAIGAGLAWLFPVAAERQAVFIVLGLIVADWASGMLASWQRREPITSARMREGVAKTANYILVMAGIGLLTRVVNLGALGSVAVGVVAGYIGAVEVLSLVENASRGGLKIADKVLQRLRRVVAEEGEK